MKKFIYSAEKATQQISEYMHMSQLKFSEK